MKKYLFTILFITLFIPNIVFGALTDSLQGYWDLDEESSTRSDSTANGNDLTDNNTVLFGTGIISNGADFEKDNTEYLTITDVSQTGLDTTGDFTIQAWVKIEQEPASDTQWVIVAKEIDGAANGYALMYHESLGIRTVVSTGGNQAINFAHNLSTSAFEHLVFRFTDSSKEHSIWIDGSEQTGTGTDSPPDTGAAFSIASNGTNGGNNTFDGLIDEVGFWDRALTDAEIGELYNSGAGLAYPFEPAAEEEGFEWGTIIKKGFESIVDYFRTIIA